jgi:hypothetical protein
MHPPLFPSLRLSDIDTLLFSSMSRRDGNTKEYEYYDWGAMNMLVVTAIRRIKGLITI